MLVYLDGALKRRRELAAAERRPFTEDDLKAAIQDGAVLRVRPTFMTMTAIIAGLLPIKFDGGTGTEVMRHLAARMVGDMVSATVLALPTMYYL